MNSQVQTGSENEGQRLDLSLEVAGVEFLTTAEGVPYVAIGVRPIILLKAEALALLARLDAQHKLDVRIK